MLDPDIGLATMTGSLALAAAGMFRLSAPVWRKSKGGQKAYLTELEQALLEESLQIREQLELARALSQGIDRGELSLVYQPKVNAEGRTIGAEALSRWYPTNRPACPPSEFIPAAEKHGVMPKLTKAVISKVCAQLRAWADAGVRVPGRVSFNVPPSHLSDDLIDHVAGAIEAARVPAAWLEVELTESEMADVTPEFIARLGRLKSMGLTISLDDFGAGYSSLAYLSDIPADVIKIDRRFVSHIGNERSETLFVGIMQIARSMGFGVLAEGVETQEQAEILKRIGCGAFQGFLYSKPLAADEMSDWLHN